MDMFPEELSIEERHVLLAQSYPEIAGFASGVEKKKVARKVFDLLLLLFQEYVQ
jgi:hypothetical protein